MKETRFIAQNKEKWQESEELLKSPVKDPEKLTNLFVQVIDDLSFSRTYYPNRSVRVYLNKIGREYFNIIYNHKKEKRNRFMAFWLDELPQIVYNSRKQLLLSLIVFLFAMAIGVFSAVKDPNFTSTILGDGYVQMTKENIESGDPMAVYKSRNELDMFLAISVNNLRVAFLTYVCGVFFSLGTLMVLLYNGIMVGCFQYFFVEQGLFQESALTIWLHGTIEISCIILAGGAGLILGSGLIFPGTYSRMQAFQMSAIRSLKLMLGLFPLIVLAALIESFLTRYTEVSDLLRLFLILLSATFIIGYFVIYPWMKARSGFDQPLEEASLPPDTEQKVRYDRINSNAEILKDCFQLYKRFGSQIIGWIAGISFVTAVIEVSLNFSKNDVFMPEEWFAPVLQAMFYGASTPNPFFIAVNAIISGTIAYRIMMFVDADAKKTTPRRYNIKALFQSILITGIFYSMVHFLGGWGLFLAFLSFLFFLLISFIQHYEGSLLPSAIARFFTLMNGNWGKAFGLQAIILLILISFLMILSAPVLYFNIEILQWNFGREDSWANTAVNILEVFIKLFGFNLTLPIMAISSSLLYFSLLEISTAQSLQKSIELIGTRISRKRF